MQLSFPGLAPPPRVDWTSLYADDGSAMARSRNAWAKVYCDFLQHPKILGRSDCGKLLFLGLILYAKFHAPDSGVIYGLGPEEMRGAFGIKAPLKAVEDALLGLLNDGLVLRSGDNGFIIKSFVERQQRAGDTPEAHADRQQKYRQKKKGVTSLVRVGDATGDVRVPRGDGTRSDAEEEEEKRDDLSAQSHEGEKPLVHSLPVDNLEGLNAADRAQVQRIASTGDGVALAAFLASVKRGAA